MQPSVSRAKIVRTLLALGVIVCLVALLLFWRALRSREQRAQAVRQYASAYHLDPDTALAKYRDLTSNDWGDHVRARMYFEENRAFEVLAFALGGIHERYLRGDILKGLAGHAEYSPQIAHVLLEALDEYNREPPALSGEEYAGQRVMKAEMSGALARWLRIPAVEAPFREGYSAAQHKYQRFISDVRQRLAPRRGLTRRCRNKLARRARAIDQDVNRRVIGDSSESFLM